MPEINPYRSISTWSQGRERVHVIVDSPKGSRNKYKFDNELNIFRLSHMLPPGSTFPYDFGAIPKTLAEDGDPLDVLVLADESTFVGCLLDVRLIGVIEAEQASDGKTVRNDRLLGVPITAVNPPSLQELSELETELVSNIELFFRSYNEAHGRTFRSMHRRGAKAAQMLVSQACARYEDQETH
jgi:inorganic pyrophosphatase